MNLQTKFARLGAGEWQQIIEQQIESGLSQKDFCQSLYGKLLDTNPITGRWIKPANYRYHCSSFTCRVPYHVPL